jgi:hypothetical protein
MTAVEIKFVRRIADCIHLENKRNLDIIKELITQPATEFIENYRANWKNHILHRHHLRIPS